MRLIDKALPGEFPDGTWRLVIRDGKKAAIFSCPHCGFRGGIGHGTDHVIDYKGVVTPSVVCDTEHCFHDYITLVDWKYG